MKAWTLPALTGVESMSINDIPNPTPAPNEVILEVAYAGLNPADNYLAIGQYPAKPTFPHILGRDGAGKVIALGSNVSNIQLGETRMILRSDVGVNRPGTLAQQVAVEADYTVPVPTGWSLEQAAGAGLVYQTAWQALTQWGDLKPNAIVLITGASGGVGVASVQLATALGCRVIALSRSKEKGEQLKKLGAEIVLDPTEKSWRKTLKEKLGKSRVNLAIDSVGGDLFNELLEVMDMWGNISVVGRLAGPVPNFNTAALFFRRLKIGGVAINTYTNPESLDVWSKVVTLMQQTNKHPLIDHIFPFTQVKEAFARLAEGPMGKVIVQVSDAL